MNDVSPVDQVEDWEPILHQRDDLQPDLTLCGLPWLAQPVLGVEPLLCRACIRERQRRRGVGRYAES